MGCVSSSSSSSVAEVVYEAPASSSPPVTLTCSQVSKINLEVEGFSPQEQSKRVQQGRLYQHISEAGHRGLQLTACFVDPTRVDIGGLLCPGSLTLTTIFKPVAAGQTLETTSVYTLVVVDAGIGFANAKVDMNGQVPSMLLNYAQQGYRLVYTIGVHSKEAPHLHIVELLFQKLEQPPLHPEVSVTQTSFVTTVTFGTMAVTPPDLVPFLNEWGSRGWTLTGLSLMGAQSEAPEELVSKWCKEDRRYLCSKMQEDTPVWVVMTSGSAPVKYCQTVFYYNMNIQQKGCRGDPLPLIQTYARQGWLIKGAMVGPAEFNQPTLMTPVWRFPLLLVFEAQISIPSNINDDGI